MKPEHMPVVPPLNIPTRDFLGRNGFPFVTRARERDGFSDWGRSVNPFLDAVLDHAQPKRIRGSCVATEVLNTGYQDPLPLFLSPLTEFYRDDEPGFPLRMTGSIGVLLGALQSYTPNVDMHVTPEEFEKALQYPYNPLDLKRYIVLPNGIRALNVRLRLGSAGYAQFNLVDRSGISEDRRQGISTRLDACWGVLNHTPDNSIVEISGNNRYALVQPDSIYDLSQLPHSEQLCRILRILRFNHRFPPTSTACYPGAPVFDAAADTVLKDALRGISVDDLSLSKYPYEKGYYPQHIANITSEGMTGFLYRPYNWALMMRDCDPSLYPYQRRNHMQRLVETLQQRPLRWDHNASEKRERFDITDLILELATPEARLVAKEAVSQLQGEFHWFFHPHYPPFSWHLSDTGYLALLLAFCPVPITELEASLVD